MTLILEIIWPSGQKDAIAEIKPNQSLTVQEGKGVTATEPIIFVLAAPTLFVAERRLSLAQPFKAGITHQPNSFRRVSDG